MLFFKRKQKQRPSVIMGVDDIGKLKKFLALFDDPRIKLYVDKYGGNNICTGRLSIKSVGDENSEISHNFTAKNFFHLFEDMNKWYMKNRHHFVVLDNVITDPNEQSKDN